MAAVAAPAPAANFKKRKGPLQEWNFQIQQSNSGGQNEDMDGYSVVFLDYKNTSQTGSNEQSGE
jgi:hypothetical protein